jgi:hypothetical protein
MLSAFALWNLQVLTPMWFRKHGHSFHLRTHEFVLLLTLVLLLLFVTFFVLPASFREGLNEQHVAIPQTFNQIVLPYFPYCFYNLGLSSFTAIGPR